VGDPGAAGTSPVAGAARVPALEVAARCDPGRVRRSNQDAYRVDVGRGVLVVADGMGGHRAGDVASRIAADAVLERLVGLDDSPEGDPAGALVRLGRAVEEANAALFGAIAQSPELEGMGTTLVVAVFSDGCVHHAHVGDSRLYRWRDGAIEPLTRDHSLVQQLLDRGVFASREQALEAGVGTHILTRGLGIASRLDVALGSHPLATGDLYLLCTDGLTNIVDDAGLAALLDAHGSDLQSAAEELLRAALAGGGPDNVTIVLARPIVSRGQTPPSGV
jgi:protein phosphatase